MRSDMTFSWKWKLRNRASERTAGDRRARETADVQRTLCDPGSRGDAPAHLSEHLGRAARPKRIDCGRVLYGGAQSRQWGIRHNQQHDVHAILGSDAADDLLFRVGKNRIRGRIGVGVAPRLGDVSVNDSRETGSVSVGPRQPMKEGLHFNTAWTTFL